VEKAESATTPHASILVAIFWPLYGATATALPLTGGGRDAWWSPRRPSGRGRRRWGGTGERKGRGGNAAPPPSRFRSKRRAEHQRQPSERLRPGAIKVTAPHLARAPACFVSDWTGPVDDLCLHRGQSARTYDDRRSALVCTRTTIHSDSKPSLWWKSIFVGNFRDVCLVSLHRVCLLPCTEAVSSNAWSSRCSNTTTIWSSVSNRHRNTKSHLSTFTQSSILYLNFQKVQSNP
jgi:hypothetical protein